MNLATSPARLPRPDRVRLALLVGLGLAASAFLYLLLYLPRDGASYSFGYPFGRDFINFWVGGQLVAAGTPGIMVDVAAYNDWIARHVPAADRMGFILSYPPLIAPFLLPFGLLSFGWALALWTVLNIAVAGAALAAAAGSLKRRALLLGLAAPALAVNAFQGLLCGFTAALMLTIVTSMKQRPWLAGLCLGLLTIKPQMAGIVAIIVLASGHWRVLAAGAITVAALVAVSVALVGVETWAGYVTVILPEQARFLKVLGGGFRYFLVTPYSSLRLLGLGASAASLLQGLLTLAAVAAAVAGARRLSDPIRLALLAGLATLVATPYANLYDMTIVALPLALLIARDGVRPELAAPLVTLWLLPAIGLPINLMIGPFAALLLLGATALLLPFLFSGQGSAPPGRVVANPMAE